MSEQLLKRIQEQGEFWAKSGMRFLTEDRCNEIATMSRSQIDELEIGVVKVTDNGTILLYNKCESIKASVLIHHAEGKLFFTQIAPCTNNGIFYGSFKKGITDGKMDLVFPYTFTYRMKPAPVIVHLFRHQRTKTNWIFVHWK